MTPAHPPVWSHLARAAAAREAAGMSRALRPREADQQLIDVASNDYLSLARDPRLAAVAVSATQRWGTGATASRLVVGALALHSELERALAAFVGAPSALLFSSGYLANLAALTALTDANTLIVSDEANHASLIDGCRLSRAEVAVYPHLDVETVGRLLANRRQARALVVTDAVFSVDGSRAPLARLHREARANGAALVVDEAHSLGIVGTGGVGGAAAAGIAGEPDVVLTVTLSKSLGAQGGAVLGPPSVIDALVNTARTMIFDTGLAPAPTAAALAALQILQADPGLPAAVRRVNEALRAEALAAGWECRASHGAVLSLQVGDAEAAVAAQNTCAEHGVSVGCFRPPSVPEGEACLRITAKAATTAADIAQVGRALRAAKSQTSTHAPAVPAVIPEPSPASNVAADSAECVIRLVTGTGTGVGKTIVTAALAAAALAAGHRVTVVKPVQTGVAAQEEGDVDVVQRLVGSAVRCVELIRYPDPLSPEAAARVSEREAPTVADLAERILALGAASDIVLVEGAGGALVRFNSEGETFADLAAELRRRSSAPVEVVVVTDPALGTLNHTALTMEALDRRGLAETAVVLGTWPMDPDLACRENLVDLPRIIRAPIAGILPANAAALSPTDFRAVAEAGLAPELGGRFNGSIGTTDVSAETSAPPPDPDEPRME